MKHGLISILIISLMTVSCGHADVASKLKSFTGKHTRMVWCESTGNGTDAMCKKAIHKLVGIDTDDGKGVRVIRGVLGSYSAPLITPKGDRIIYSSYITGKVHIINWDGSGHKTLVPGYATDVWLDPDSDIEYVYVRTKTSSPDSPIIRYAIDDTSLSSAVWDKTQVGSMLFGVWFQVSADGKRAAGTFPWSSAGLAYLPNGSLKGMGRGCWTSIAPDNSYDFWVFNDDHRTVRVYDANGKQKGVLDLHTAPGMDGWEIYHPRWASDPNFVTMNGPYDANRGGSCAIPNCGNLITQGGKRMNMYIGKLNEARTSVIKWLKITDNNVPEFFGDAWIAADPPKPQLNLNPGSLAFAGSLGGSAPAAKTVTADGLYGLSLNNIRVTENAPWLSVSVGGSGASRTLTNTVSIAGLGVGKRSAKVSVNAGGKTKKYIVSLSVVDISKYHKKFNFGGTHVPGWKPGGGYSSGGVDFSTQTRMLTSGVTNAAPEAVYQSCRRDGFEFNKAVANGNYTVRLHLSEPYWGSVADSAKNRATDIKLEGLLVEDNLDPATAAGAVKKAAVIDHQVTVSDGELTMDVRRGDHGDDAFLMGIEIIGRSPNRNAASESKSPNTP